MDSGSVTPWADLPKELVEKIDSCPSSTQIDVLCLRSVCTTWRSAIPPFKNFPSLPLKLQVPIIPNDTDTFGSNPEFYLIDSTVYLIQPIDTNKPSSSSSRSGWLVKVMQTADGKLRVLNPLCHKAMDVTPEDVSNKSGDEKWTTLRDDSCKSILDIIVYKGNFYAVDLDGETIKFDYSLNETKVASRLHNMRVAVRRMKKKRLVESSGQLFLVDVSSYNSDPNEVDRIRIYWLDKQKHEWTRVYKLGHNTGVLTAVKPGYKLGPLLFYLEYADIFLATTILA
ncbi:hypothetical protein KY290_014923 [Solanum tuberosum]|uniref:KIB1-4 beta-propeller domain-containing protein n=1 Tax=Solanum tuberosum TaxID=4113 RepID=A0ABQ7VTQ3_SOLTU|nr:hypothetical protein KY285_014361 [Solanum tuberosum]KAH0770942.1 hypothetical protein KY290_014923 [Solanum tuberosum]